MITPIDPALFSTLTRTAREAPRRRTNHNFHSGPDDPVQRFLNVLEPGSYIRPHRHVDPLKWELFLLLAGRAAILVLDDDGRVLERLELDPEGARGAEIPAGAWHTIVALAPGTVLFELKPGPYTPAVEKDFAPWAPPEGSPEAAGMEQRLREARPGIPLADAREP